MRIKTEMTALLLFMLLIVALVGNAEAGEWTFQEQVHRIEIDSNVAMLRSGEFSEGKRANGNVCGPDYDTGNAGNDYCHKKISEATHAVIVEKGYSNTTAHAGAFLVWIVKEWIFDTNPDKGDIWSAPYIYDLDQDTHIKGSCNLQGDCEIGLSIDF